MKRDKRWKRTSWNERDSVAQSSLSHRLEMQSTKARFVSNSTRLTATLPYSPGRHREEEVTTLIPRKCGPQQVSHPSPSSPYSPNALLLPPHSPPLPSHPSHTLHDLPLPPHPILLPLSSPLPLHLSRASNNTQEDGGLDPPTGNPTP